MANTYNKVTQLLVDLIQIPSITPVAEEHRPASKKTLEVLRQQLSQSGAKCHWLTFSGGHEKWNYTVDNLYVEWTFGKPDYHLCFLGHTDVVPVGNESLWSVEPFSGIRKDGWIYGRGATDMKGAIAAYAIAASKMAEEIAKLPEGKQGNFTLSMVITTDEEWAAINGTDKVLNWLKQNGKKPDAFIVGEPSSQDELGTHIKLGRRGSLCGTIVAKGVQGHAAYSGLFVNPNRALGLTLSILQTHKFTDLRPDFPKSEFEIIALESGSFSATAIIPAEASALWNCRFTPSYQPQEILDALRDLISNPPSWAKQHPDFDLLDNIEIKANIDTVSLPYYSPPGKLSAIALQSVQAVFNSTPDLDGTGGTTDGRFIHKYYPGAEIIELGLPEKGGMKCGHQSVDYGRQGGMHQIDERCLEKDLHSLYEIYSSILSKVRQQLEEKSKNEQLDYVP